MLGPAFADFDEIAADMGPAEDQHHVAQLHLGHGFVRRVAVDHQHHAGVLPGNGPRAPRGCGWDRGERPPCPRPRTPTATSDIPSCLPGDEDHPASLVGLGEGGCGIAFEQRVIKRLKQRFEAFQATGHRARRQVQTQQPPLVQQPLGGPVAGELVDQDLHPHRDAQQSLGNQLGGRGSGERSRTVRAGACPPVTSSPDQPAIGRTSISICSESSVSLGERAAPHCGQTRWSSGNSRGSSTTGKWL